jgi:tetratricopeptide (TPR) repeat protein
VGDKKTLKGGGDSNVIRVSFGPGGGRVDGEVAPSPPPSPEPSSREPVADVYTQKEVAQLLGMSPGRLRTLDKAKVVVPTGRRKGRRAYTFSDIIALRVARDLLGNKVRLREVAKSIEAIRKMLPRVSRPLSELRIASDGKQVVVRSDEGPFEPATGQMLLDFDVADLRDDVVRVLRPAAGTDRARIAYELYLKASQLDEAPESMAEAEQLYRRALEYDPWLAIVYTNLGNIRFRSGDEKQAQELYRAALDIEAQQPEAQYNLGYMMMHRGRTGDAIAFFLGAIESDPQFADAYFNLAMAYEQHGDSVTARGAWEQYLALEPTGTWADIAREHLDR